FNPQISSRGTVPCLYRWKRLCGTGFQDLSHISAPACPPMSLQCPTERCDGLGAPSCASRYVSSASAATEPFLPQTAERSAVSSSLGTPCWRWKAAFSYTAAASGKPL
ncbi:hypothetical protein GOODEAATRI_015779, partial [Goodea atripinnis]